MEQLAARWAHNPKVAGSSPASATNYKYEYMALISIWYKSFLMDDNMTTNKKSEIGLKYNKAQKWIKILFINI